MNKVPYWLTKKLYEIDPYLERMVRKILTVHVPVNEIKEICRLIEIEKNYSYEAGIWSAKLLIQKAIDERNKEH